MKKLSLASLTIFFMLPAIIPLTDSLLNLHLHHFDSYKHISLGIYKVSVSIFISNGSLKKKLGKKVVYEMMDVMF